MCGVWLDILVWTRSPHKDRKTRTIQTSEDILQVHTMKNAFLAVRVQIRGMFSFGVKVSVRLAVRENRILNGNQLFGPHKDSKTN